VNQAKPVRLVFYPAVQRVARALTARCRELSILGIVKTCESD
jgi:hypothetical protein